AAVDGRPALGPGRLSHHRPISAADPPPSSGGAFRPAGRVQGLRDHRLRQRISDGVVVAADALLASRRRRLGPAARRAGYETWPRLTAACVACWCSALPVPENPPWRGDLLISSASR